MTTDRALDILAMSEQARWREGIEPEDERKAIETIREALRSKLSVDVLDKIKGYIDHIRNTGMGKKKSLEFIVKFIEGLKAEQG